MSNPQVSCIVPVYNGARYLGEALQSILGQSHRPIEMLVVDDGSTDASAEIARSHHESIRVIQQPNQGQAVAVARGVEAAQGDFLAFLDADDLWHPEKLSLQLASLADGDFDYSVARMRNFLSPDRELEGDAVLDPSLLEPRGGFVFGALLASREVFQRIGPPEAERRHSYDTDWFVRARIGGAREVQLTDVLLERRLHGGNISLRQSDRSRDEYLELVRATLARRRQQQA